MTDSNPPPLLSVRSSVTCFADTIILLGSAGAGTVVAISMDAYYLKTNQNETAKFRAKLSKDYKDSKPGSWQQSQLQNNLMSPTKPDTTTREQDFKAAGLGLFVAAGIISLYYADRAMHRLFHSNRLSATRPVGDLHAPQHGAPQTAEENKTRNKPDKPDTSERGGVYGPV